MAALVATLGDALGADVAQVSADVAAKAWGSVVVCCVGSGWDQVGRGCRVGAVHLYHDAWELQRPPAWPPRPTRGLRPARPLPPVRLFRWGRWPLSLPRCRPPPRPLPRTAAASALECRRGARRRRPRRAPPRRQQGRRQRCAGCICTSCICPMLCLLHSTSSPHAQARIRLRPGVLLPSPGLRSKQLQHLCAAPSPAPLPCLPLHCTASYRRPHRTQVLRVLLERMRNDATRLTAVKALATIARSPLNIGVPGGL